MPLILDPIYENDFQNNNIDVGFPGGTKGYVTALPTNPLFSFKANGFGTYNTDYLLPLYVDDDDGSIKLVDDGDDILLANGFDSLAEGATVTDTFTIEYTTGEGTTSEEVTVTITGKNDDPTAVDDLYGFVIDNNDLDGVDIDVLANDYDIDTFDNETTVDPDTDGDTISIVSFTNGTYGTVSLAGTKLNYTPTDSDYIGIDTFEYTIADGKGGFDTATVTVVVGPSNAPPVATDDSYSVDEDDGSATLGNVLTNDSDPDGDLLGAVLKVDLYLSDIDGNPVDWDGNPTVTPITDGIGDIEFYADGTFSYDPEGAFNHLKEGETAYVSYEYTAFDGDLSSSDDGLVVITINGENDLPGTPENQSGDVYEAGIDGSGSLAANITYGDSDEITFDFDLAGLDPDGDTLAIVFDTDGTGSYGSFTIDDADSVSYKLTSNADHSGGSVTDTVLLRVSDGTGESTSTFTATVNIIDDQPYLEIAPTDLAGSTTTVDEVANGSVLFMATQTYSDTFTFIPGADSGELKLSGIPAEFDVVAGDTTITVYSDWTTSGGDLVVTGHYLDGDGVEQTWYTLVIDPDFDTANNLAKYTYTQFGEPPTDRKPIDFSSVKAGGPQEVLTEPDSGVAFDGFFFSDDDWSDGIGDRTDSDKGDDDINPNNAGGIGVGDGNVSQFEGIEVDLTGATAGPDISGISFELTLSGGNAPELVTVIWVAYDNLGGIYSGTVEVDFTNDPSNNKVETVDIEPELVGGATELTSVSFALDPNDLDHNDNYRINEISTIEAFESGDYILPFQIYVDEGSIDGDETSTVDFSVEVDGPLDGDTSFGLADADLFMA